MLYVMCLAPLAEALDRLQADNKYFGHLLPTLRRTIKRTGDVQLENTYMNILKNTIVDHRTSMGEKAIVAHVTIPFFRMRFVLEENTRKEI